MPDSSPLPLEAWCADMQTAVEDIQRIGLEIVEKHSGVSEKAAENAAGWKLAERQREECDALIRLFKSIREIMIVLDTVFQFMRSDTMSIAANTIDMQLPVIEQAFLKIRHAALDLLRWTLRAGRMEGSPLPDEYRAAYSRLISYAPVFRPRLEKLQNQLLNLSKNSARGSAVHDLLSAITRYNGVMDTARGFVQAIIDPPLELTFQETNLFLEDWEKTGEPERMQLATELNDCCQFMLYEEREFLRRVEQIKPELSGGFEASMYSMPINHFRVLFTVDEDPVFRQLTVTLYRLVPETEFDAARQSLIETLYREWI